MTQAIKASETSLKQKSPRPASRRKKAKRTGLTKGSPQPHTPQQDLELFGTWTSKPIWVPPKDSSKELAKSMLNSFGAFASKDESWEGVVKENRSRFTQVRKMELPRASIRLPQGQLYVMVTERENFDQIEEEIPRCVQTRLDEFLAGPGMRRGVKVYYLKPLCIEVGSDLIFTTDEELEDAISQIKSEVFTEYRRQYLGDRARRLAVNAAHASLAAPRAFIKSYLDRKKRQIDAYHAKLEFERRRRAHEAMKMRRKYRRDDCTYEELLGMTNAPNRDDVIKQYVEDNSFSNVDQQLYSLVSTESLPWFATLSLAALKLLAVSLQAGVSVAVCDPAFVAVMPGQRDRLLKIGHFDEVDGVMHVEI